MVEAKDRLVQHHQPDHLVHGKKGGWNGDYRQAADQKQKVQLKEGDALQLENLQKAGRTSLFRGVFFDTGAGGAVIVAEEQVKQLLSKWDTGPVFYLQIS